MYQKIIITTTESIQGKPIKEYLGIVSGEAILRGNSFKDLKAAFWESGARRSTTRESIMKEGREAALDEMEACADMKGANAIVGVQFDFEAVGTTETMLMVAVSGTAVIVE